MRSLFFTAAAALSLLAAGPLTGAEPASPDLQEVLGLIRTHLPGGAPETLNPSAVEALLEGLKGKVLLRTNPPSASGLEGASGIAKSTRIDGAFAYLRVDQIGAGTGAAMGRALEEVRGTNRLKGLVLDLRFASGTDLTAAAAVADWFVDGTNVLFRVGQTVVCSPETAPALELPLAVLVNGRTSGAAEVLAAVLRRSGQGLLFGGATAGQVGPYKDFPLKSGQVLQIATETVEVGEGLVVGSEGVAPDIRVEVSLEDDRSYVDDPYRLPSRLAGLAGGALPAAAPAAGAGRSRRRINEAELVRMQRQGTEPVPAAVPGSAEPAETPVLLDPVLARGLDLLKGLAVAGRGR